MPSVYFLRRVLAVCGVATLALAGAAVASADGGSVGAASSQYELPAHGSPAPSAPVQGVPVECLATAQELRCSGYVR